MRKRLTSLTIMLMIIAGAAAGAGADRTYAATVTGGQTGKSVVTNLGNGADNKGWKNPHCSWGKQFRYTVKVNGESKVGYCMEPGKDFSASKKYTAAKAANAAAWKKLSSAKQRVLALVLYYGYNSGKSAPYGNSNDYYAATQVLVWEAVDGKVTLSESGKWSKTSNKHDDLISGRKYAQKNYDWMKSKISAHVKGASFTARTQSAADTYILKYNYSTKKWSRTLTDSNSGNYLRRHSDTYDSLSTSRSGYKYTFSTSTSGSKKAVFVNDKSPGTSQAMLVLAPAKTTDQALIFGATDQTKFYINFRTEKQGTCKIVKTSSDGKVSGFKFLVECKDKGYSKVHTTDSGGNISVSLYPGTYTITEQLTDSQKVAGYEAASSKTVTIKEGAASTVKIHNTRDKEDFKIKKTSDNGVVEGFRFVVKDAAGKAVLEEVTDKDGLVSGKLYPGTYTVSESLTTEQKEDGYIQPASQKLTLKANQKETVQLKFHNRKVPEGGIMIKKENLDGSSPEGFEFEIQNIRTGDAVTCITDENGNAVLPELTMDEYQVTEILTEEQKQRYETPETQRVTLTEDGKTVVVNFENTPKTTDLEIRKLCIDGNVAGKEFEIKGTLSWGEVFGPCTVVTDADGVAEVRNLQPGEYVITELSDDNRYEKPDPVTVKITGNEEEKVTVEMENIPAALYITKVDEDTGGFLDGSEFELLDKEGDCITSFYIRMNDGRVLLELNGEASGVMTDDACEETSFGCLLGLVPGERYVLKEVTVPEGYQRAEDMEFVFEEGMHLEVRNRKIEETPDIMVINETEPTQPATEEDVVEETVQTGDAENLLLEVGLALLAMAVISMVCFRREKKNN